MFCSMGLWALINSYDMTVHARMATKHSKNASVYSILKIYKMSLSVIICLTHYTKNPAVYFPLALCWVGGWGVT